MRSSARFGWMQSRGHDGFDSLIGVPLGTEARQRRAKRKASDKPPFARRFCSYMTYAGVDAQALVERLRARGVEATERQILYFRGADATPETVRDPVLLHDIATELKCKVADFFNDPTTEPTPQSINPIVERAMMALDGPKAAFLSDAIDMAYAAWLTSQRN